MSFEYTELTDEQRQQLVRGRIAQFEAEHYSHELNLIGIDLDTSLTTTQRVELRDSTAAAMATLETVIEANRVALDDAAPQP